MSKNFELLQRAGEDDLFDLPGLLVARPRETHGVLSVRKDPPPDTEITKLVQRLFALTGAGNGHKVVSFSGIARDDRSGWICARAGKVLAGQVDSSVCIVDANLWSPQLHVRVEADQQAALGGLAEALTTKAPIRSFAIPLCGGKLSVIPAGVVKPGYYTSTDRYRERFAELREAFDYVLISAPALNREAGATSIAQLADGVVLIIEANRSRRESVRRLKEQLEIDRVNLLGAVLDQRTFPIPEWLYQRL